MVTAKALIGSQLSDWRSNVWVDNPNGNEDPFVFSERWLYSYCHATQLRRSPRRTAGYVGPGSYLFFCSGDATDNEVIQLDTVFVVDHVAIWPDHGKGLPEEFQEHFMNKNSDLWRRHLRYPFYGYHEGKYTYVGRPWLPRRKEYSFLTISHSGDKVGFDLHDVASDLRLTIVANTRGKYPVPVSETQKEHLRLKVLLSTNVQVIGNLIRAE